MTQEQWEKKWGETFDKMLSMTWDKSTWVIIDENGGRIVDNGSV